MNARTRTTALLASAVALTGALAVTAPPASAGVTISGYVMCVDQLPVEGVWIVANSGGSGWAQGSFGSSYNARFSYTLPNGGSWTIHTGCGGSPQSWRYLANGNVSTSRTNQSWTCYTRDIASYAFCQTS
jgi:hypothetical protein